MGIFIHLGYSTIIFPHQPMLCNIWAQACLPNLRFLLLWGGGTNIYLSVPVAHLKKVLSPLYLCHSFYLVNKWNLLIFNWKFLFHDTLMPTSNQIYYWTKGSKKIKQCHTPSFKAKRKTKQLDYRPKIDTHTYTHTHTLTSNQS